MSHYCVDDLSKRELIARFVIETRSTGHMLSYLDYEVIDRWLLAARGDADALLLTLDEVLPEYFSNNHDKRISRSLRGIEKKVLSCIKTSPLT